MRTDDREENISLEVFEFLREKENSRATDLLLNPATNRSGRKDEPASGWDMTKHVACQECAT